jgi:integrase
MVDGYLTKFDFIFSLKLSDKFRVFIDPKVKETYKYASGLRKYTWMPTLKAIGVKYRYPYQGRQIFASMMLTQSRTPMGSASQTGTVK